MGTNIIIELSPGGFASVVRMVHRGDADKVQWIRTATYTAMQKLGIARDATKAIRKTPKGSDQFDTGSLLTWMNGLKITDKKAIAQLVALDATAVARS